MLRLFTRSFLMISLGGCGASSGSPLDGDSMLTDTSGSDIAPDTVEPETDASDTVDIIPDDIDAEVANPDDADGNIVPDDLVLGVPERLRGLGAGELTAIAAHGGQVLVGTPHGLFGASAPDYSLAPVGGRDLGLQKIFAIASFADDLFAVGDAGWWRSVDGGDTWMDVSTGSCCNDAQFAVSAERLVLSAGPHVWDADSQSWVKIDTSIPADGGVSEAFFDAAFGLDGQRLFGNIVFGVPETGVYSLDLATPQATWQRVTNLGGGPVLAFAFDPSRAAASSSTQIRVRSGDAWPASFTLTDPEEGPPALGLFIRDGVVLAAGASKLRRSTDGTNWTVVSDTVTRGHNGAFAADDERIFRTDRALLSSSDLGATWIAHENDIAVPQHMSVANGVTFAMTDAGIFRAGASEQSFGLVGTVLSHASRLHTLSATEYWACDALVCTRLLLASGAQTTVTLPPDTRTPALLVSTRLGVFTMDAGWNGASCGGQAPGYLYPMGLFRHDAEIGTWVSASAGLPTRAACNGVVGFEQVTDIFEASGVLFATVGAETYRSENAGRSWARVDSLGRLAAASGCGPAILALRADGSLAVSTDRGATFDTPAMTFSDVSDIAPLGGGCVLGTRSTDGSSTLFTSRDGASFVAVPGFTAPVGSLAADATTLAVATYSRGVLRLRID